MPAVNRLSFILFCAFLIAKASETRGKIGPMIQLKDGAIRGRYEMVPDGQDVEVFHAIPYADPPVGELRFSAPRALSKAWEGVLDCTQQRTVCCRGPFIPSGPNATNADEDCLSLNVYRPANIGQNHSLPVMVWFTGGGFYIGSTNLYDGSALASYHDVIIVTVNFRLGLLGFLNIPGTPLKGNYGMLDQVQALKWVQENIASFGGNPAQVTIFGVSAGGASVGLHMLSPLSKGLFRYGILMSGVANSPFGSFSIKHDDSRFDVFLERLQCVEKTELMSCLRKKTVEEIIEAQGVCDCALIGTSLPVPNVDGEFLPEEPRVLLAQGRFNKPDAVIVGATDDEGALYTYPVTEQPNLESFKTALQKTSFTQNGESEEIKEIILKQYMKNPQPTPEEVVRNWSDLFGDSWFVVPAVFSARSFVKAGIPTYFYQFTHRSKLSEYPSWVGCSHVAELQFIFGSPFIKDYFLPKIGQTPSYNEEDEKVSSTAMKMWTSFAKNGMPQDPGTVTWPPYSTEREEYLDIGLVPKVGRKLKSDRVDFWEEVIYALKNEPSKFQKRSEL